MDTELGTRRDAAYLKVANKADPPDFAVVWTPGDRWFSLDVAGGFSLVYIEEETPGDEVRERLDSYLSIGLRYLSGDRENVRSKLLRIPSVRVGSGGNAVTLRLSLVDEVRHLFGRRREG
ncbi:hypothetical protein [Pseudolysinimonas yzui]|uniref:hypothetical protein n=1 Tax=Pseudolysinimonas yzui TaxID=2708254 RepID=UPI00174E3F29|nr:hypothetical protein [Pseudolysinimonas yzui]